MRIPIKKDAITVCLCMTVYYAMMELYYYYFICEYYPRFGFVLDINTFKYAETKLVFVIILGISLYVSRVSGFIYSIFIFFIIFFLVPTLITYSFSDQMGIPMYSIVALLVILGLFASTRIKIPHIRSASLSYETVMVFVLLAFIPILFTFGIYFNPRNLLLVDVYSTREIFDVSASAGINYFFNWLIKALVPVCLIFFLIHKQNRYAFFCFVILLYLYLVSGNKLVYITAFIMLFFFFFGKDYLQRTKIISIALVVGLAIVPLVDFYFFQNHTLKGAFIMRMLFLPSVVNYFYIDFFTDLDPLFFAESHFFGWFAEYPFNRPIGFVIAERYFNATDMNANNGIISDGFMNLGYWGIGLNIATVSAIFIFFNSLNLDSRYLGIFFVAVFLFLSAPMLSMFVTSGLWILFILALTVMREPKAGSAPIS